MTELFDATAIQSAEEAVDVIETILAASTEYSIIGLDADATIVLWNEGARRLYGWEPAELVGRANADILLTPEDREAGLPARMREAALRGGKWEGTVTRRRRDGSTFRARVSMTPRRNDDGRVKGFVIVSRDISDELRLTELEAIQTYTRSLIESNADVLVTTDQLGVVTDVNRPTQLLTGRSRDQLLGSHFKEHFADPDRAEDLIRQAVSGGRVDDYELSATSGEGETVVMSFNASVYHDRDGRLQGVFAAARDITQQKLLETALRDQQRYLRGLIESSVDALVTVDAYGFITDVNEQMCRMSGFEREELLGTAFASRFADTERAAAAIAAALEHGRATNLTLTLAAASGPDRIVSLNASVFQPPDGSARSIFASARDVTEEAELRAKLDRQGAYYRRLIEASLDGLVAVSRTLVITDVNEQMCRLTGRSREELVGSDFAALFTDHRRATAGARAALDQGALTNYELTLCSAEGEERLVSLNAARLDEADGDGGALVASARDVTDQAQMQSRLAQERAYQRRLIEASVDGLVTVDETLRIRDVNDTFCTIVGRPRGQLIGTSFPDHFTEREEAVRGIQLTLQVGQVTNYVLTLVAADERSVPVSFNAGVLRDEAGGVYAVVASARDISDQKEMERQLRDNQAYTRSLIESNVDALMATDLVGIVTDVNQQMEALTGRSREELIGSPFKHCFANPDRAEEAIRRVLRDGRVANYELTAVAADGHETVVSYSATAFHDRDGRLSGVFAAARDVTDNKALEEQLLKQQAYQKALIESLVDGVFTVDPDGFVLDVNERACRMIGYGRAELVGTRFADYFAQPDRALRGVEDALGAGVLTDHPLTLVSRSGRSLQVSVNASIFRDPDGRVRGVFASARDVTERARLEERLREQQAYLRGLIEASLDGLVTIDPEGVVTDVNESMCAMAGRDRQELIGSAFAGWFTEPDQAGAGVRRTLADGSVNNFALVLRTADEWEATVSLNASVFRDADGSIGGIFASARDVSEQARLQVELAEQQAYTRSLIETSADALFVVAPDGLVTDVNEEAIRLTGHSRRHLIGTGFSGYFNEPPRARAGLERAFSERRVIDHEVVLVTRQGEHVTVSINAAVFNDRFGHAAGILASARDVTAQKRLELQLRDSERYARSLIESNVDALVTTDPLGLITDLNQQMEALTGRDRAHLVGTPFKDCFTEPERAEEGVRQTLRDGRVTDYELTIRSSDGRETVVTYNAATLYDHNGRLTGIFAAAREVTERKRFERELQLKNVELESANQAKNRFLASMSHELRTPLNAVLGFTGTLLMGLPGPLNDEQQGQLKIVQSSGRHLLSIINDLLDLAKIEEGKWEGDFQPVDCRQVAESVVASLEPLATAKGLAIEVAPSTADAVAVTDRRALSQVLINLANNGIKFTDQGGVRLEIGEELQEDTPVVRIDVVDTGIGIRAEDQANLFRAFERLKKYGTASHEGTGLGLYISQRLAGELDGTLSFTSEVGRGSTFTFTLPRQRPARMEVG